MTSSIRPLALAIAILHVGACGVAPIVTTPGPPSLATYDGPHGRPRAFGGGVCPLTTPHRHPYPPTPAAAFVFVEGAWRDRRRIVVFDGPHELDGGRCERDGRHEHALADR